MFFYGTTIAPEAETGILLQLKQNICEIFTD
jgi:hypothetical protein